MVREQIERIESAKQGIRNAIESKGVSVPADKKIDEYPEFVMQIRKGFLNYGELANSGKLYNEL